MDMERRQFLKLAGAGIGVAALAGLGYSAWNSLFSTSKEKVMVFAGGGNKPALDRIFAEYEAANETIAVEVSYSGGGAVLAQMVNARQGDVYIPGSGDFMDRAIELDAVDPSTVETVAYLIPAICVRKGNPKTILTIDDLTREDVRVGFGNPETVAVGRIGYETAVKAGIWDGVRARIENRYAGSVNAAASLLLLGEVDAIIGWRVLASWYPDEVESILIEPGVLPRVSYVPIAISTYTKNRARAHDLLNFVLSKKNVYQEEGYITSEEEVRALYPDVEISGVYELPDDWDA